MLLMVMHMVMYFLKTVQMQFKLLYQLEENLQQMMLILHLALKQLVVQLLKEFASTQLVS